LGTILNNRTTSKVEMKNLLMTCFIIWCTLALSSCATPYQSAGFRGGYTDIQLDSNTFQVTFRGNAYTRRQSVETYLLFRCAELTAEAGYDYFIILGSDTEARQGTFSTPGTYSSTTTGSATISGNTAFGSATTHGTYSPGQTFLITKYGATAMIKAYKGEKPADNPTAFDASEILKYLGPRVLQYK